MVGSTVVLYMIFGSLGLLIVGVMGGVVLHASLENLRPNKARNEGPAIGGSAADWLDRKILEIRDRKEGTSFGESGGALFSTKVMGSVEHICGMGADNATEEQRFSRIRVSDFSTLPPETALAFTELADAVTRDYVRYEFTPT